MKNTLIKFLYAFLLCMFGTYTANSQTQIIVGQTITEATMSQYEMVISIDGKTRYGYFDGDGNAKLSGATAGNVWEFVYRPEAQGSYPYTWDFKHNGSTIQSGSGTLVTNGFSRVRKNGRYFYRDGQVEYQFGVNSPENFLAYTGFDNTIDQGCIANFLHNYSPHGGIIGAINYLASKDVNSMFFILYNLNGDGCEVYPYNTPAITDQYDVSKLDQWQQVIQHADEQGIKLHLGLWEIENQNNHNWTQRQSYMKEMVSRFGEYNVLWMQGEENGHSNSLRQDIANYIRSINDDAVVSIHNWPSQESSAWNWTGLDVMANQTYINNTNNKAKVWLNLYPNRAYYFTEQMNASNGIKPTNSYNNNFDDPIESIWAPILGGACGTEWYFGYRHAHSDLNCENFASREGMYQFFTFAKNFMSIVPVENMVSDNSKSNCLYTFYWQDDFVGYVENPTIVNVNTGSGNFEYRTMNAKTGATSGWAPYSGGVSLGDNHVIHVRKEQTSTVTLPLTYSIDDASCHNTSDGSIRLFSSYSYTWDNGSTSSFRTGLTPGTYSVNYSDGTNSNNQSFVVGSVGKVNTGASPFNKTIQVNTPITVNPSGGNGNYFVAWIHYNNVGQVIWYTWSPYVLYNSYTPSVPGNVWIKVFSGGGKCSDTPVTYTVVP